MLENKVETAEGGDEGTGNAVHHHHGEEEHHTRVLFTKPELYRNRASEWAENVAHLFSIKGTLCREFRNEFSIL